MRAIAAPIVEHVEMGSLFFLTCFFGAVFCNVKLEMFQSNGATTALVSSQINAESGRNVSLFCKLADGENHYFDTPVVWGRKGKGFRFNEEIILSTNLSFTPIRIVNQGLYFCASLRYALHKTVYVAVRTPDISNTRYRREGGIPSDFMDPNSKYNSTATRKLKGPQNFPASRNLTDTNLQKFLKKKVYVYERRDGYDAVVQKCKEYARVVVPLAAVTVVVSSVLYCLMKYFNRCATKEQVSPVMSCKHDSCGPYCKLEKSSTGRGFHNPNYKKFEKREVPEPAIPTANNEDPCIILPFLFDVLD